MLTDEAEERKEEDLGHFHDHEHDHSHDNVGSKVQSELSKK